ncbi:hypothetical protein AN191_15355 [Loktanella sp. 5RATIMAR09]|nr:MULTISPECIES: hypothetical protein [unclassified Loktanella]KQI70944.1 hypothetical protein AN191_15355 [Loktanella sp. 5RATIMAR09]
MCRRRFLVGLPFLVSACTAQDVWAPDDVVSQAVYRDPGPKHLTLYTMKNTGSDNGAHSALLINASQRVLFDPAGSWEQQQMPERNDVLFGVTPQLENYYVSFHARVTYYVVGQQVSVKEDIAEQALALALNAGSAPQANCTRFTSRLLRQLPGFEGIRQTWFPNKLSEDFASLPGVSYREYRENDADDKEVAARQIRTALEAKQ